MGRHKDEPVAVLHTVESIRSFRKEDFKGPDLYRVKAQPIIEIIDEIVARGDYPYNSDVQREAESRFGMERQGDSGSPLSVLVYNAQGYRDHDRRMAAVRAGGFEPFTQELVDRAHAEGRRVVLFGGDERCRTKDFGNGHPVRCMVPRARIRYYIPTPNHYAKIEE